MLARRGTHLLARSSNLPRRTLSTTRSRSAVYILPVDPQSPSSPVTDVDAAALWNSAPAPKDKKAAKAGTTRIFYDTPNGGKGKDITALTSLGDKWTSKSDEQKREVVRRAVGSAIKAVKALGDGVDGETVLVDASADPHAAAVAANLALYDFTLKTKPQSHFDPRNTGSLPERLELRSLSESDAKAWSDGVVYARAQNLARTLSELPGNMMTPTAFTERVQAEFAGLPNVDIFARDQEWAAEKGMRTFLSVAKGSSEPCKFLEIHYRGAASDVQPLLFVGKGVTFDTGGISIKPAGGMELMRGDMGGAAAVCSAALAVAQLKLPVNLVVLCPLTENMPGPGANKPGDIVYAMNGKSIQIDNTDAEGRLVLADALYYGTSTYQPHSVVDVATLTGAMMIALGEVYTGVFTNSDTLWQDLEKAGKVEHDLFWRMPLSDAYAPQITSSNADLCNIGGRSAGSCTAALFLKSFVAGVESSEESDSEPGVRWAHLDIAGTMESARGNDYQGKGLTGRPTRALIELVKQSAIA
ncbi:leucine aminopeptidase [Fomitopsis serialis]|uniref:leucine aminopeptidase n=1 Tax=Fomitopsis serialis TaxID=139415 RepID=UPI002008696A|nr:leucine aminopeptidase [Neoantrodia serialis]KAH9913521.1 leucine aminopeptidase [Neoantrodia serialis]